MVSKNLMMAPSCFRKREVNRVRGNVEGMGCTLDEEHSTALFN
jgi:hypothetical protein